MNALQLVRKLAVIAEVKRFSMADAKALISAVERMRSDARQYRYLREAVDNIGPRKA